MKEKLAVKSVFIAFMMVFSMISSAQSIFYCDSMLSKNKDTLFSNCKEFYNFSTNQLDSVVVIDFQKDTANVLAVRIIAPINKQNKIHGVVYGLSALDTVFKIDFNHGLIDGYFIRYCKGDTLSFTQFKNGKKNGSEMVKTICNDSDFTRTFYQDGIEVGPYVYIKKHRLLFSTALKLGKRNGVQYKYHDDGTLEWYLVYKSDKVVDGKYYRFDTLGNITEIQTYKHGKLRKSVKYDYDGFTRVIRYK